MTPPAAEPTATATLHSEFSSALAKTSSSRETRFGTVAACAGSKKAEAIACAVMTR